MRKLITIILITAEILLAADKKQVIRIGHFPNITHIQALVAHNMSRKNKGWFEQKLGQDFEIQWFIYNAGPSAMEAIFANSIDLTYVGPNPALNAFLKSEGSEIRIIAGAAEGGAALVIREDAGIKEPGDFINRKVATPQLGNTQDVMCRAWLASHGFKVTQLGGDVIILPTANPDQLTLFQNKNIDAVWTVEPWVSRLELEANGKIFLEDTNSITTVLVSSVKFLKENPIIIKKIQEAHKELTEWINKNPAEAQKLAADEIMEETKRPISPAILQKCWRRIKLTSTLSFDSLKDFVNKAKIAGFIKDTSINLSLIDKTNE